MVNESFYWFCALSGSGLFIIQFILNLIGLSHDFDLEGVEDFGKIKWLTRQALTGFLMLFGWSALACQNELQLSQAATFTIAFACGITAIAATGLIFKLALKLRSPGTVFNIEQTLGEEAIVYQRIPSQGKGKVILSIDQLTREIEAFSPKEIPSFAKVKIINIVDQNTVLVSQVNNE
ncbi:MAG: hypothetical protein LW832_06350 [Parachlamydia sp.]|jgi:hypothetical protein|nr:hypothetical protein [Parachlamydia sp.]